VERGTSQDIRQLSAMFDVPTCGPSAVGPLCIVVEKNRFYFLEQEAQLSLGWPTVLSGNL